MGGNHQWLKSILDVGMGMIKSALKAKLSDIGGLFVEVPTRKVRPSQTCPKCGHQEKKTLVLGLQKELY